MGRPEEGTAKSSGETLGIAVTFASISIAAGMNAKTLCTLMGHASIQVTYDTYGHLPHGSESEARNLFDAYLDRNGG